MREAPRGPSRKETLKAVRAGDALPTPEFVAESLASRDEKQINEGREMLAKLESQLATMKAGDTDALIKHLENLKPLVASDYSRAERALGHAESKPLAIILGTLNQLFRPDFYTFSPPKVRSAANQAGQAYWKIVLIDQLLDAARRHRTSLEG